MGLFDIFTMSSEERTLKKHGPRAANKRAQSYDRWDSIQALGSLGTPEAVEALLKRFTFRVDPSITDQEEKDAAAAAIVAAGESAVEPLQRYLRSTDRIAAPIRMLGELVDSPSVVGSLLELLEEMDIEYSRDPEKKIDLLATLELHQDERIVEAVTPFLDDANETARFHAVVTLLAQPEPPQEALLGRIGTEESNRVVIAILDGCMDKGWKIPDPSVSLPTGYRADKGGAVSKG